MTEKRWVPTVDAPTQNATKSVTEVTVTDVPWMMATKQWEQETSTKKQPLNFTQHGVSRKSSSLYGQVWTMHTPSSLTFVFHLSVRIGWGWLTDIQNGGAFCKCPSSACFCQDYFFCGPTMAGTKLYSHLAVTMRVLNFIFPVFSLVRLLFMAKS